MKSQTTQNRRRAIAGIPPGFLLPLTFLFFGLFTTDCNRSPDDGLTAFPMNDSISKLGKKKGKKRKYVYTKDNAPNMETPGFQQEWTKAVRLQKKLLEIKRRGKKNFKIGQARFDVTDLVQTTELLEQWGASAFVPLAEYFDLYQLSGKDGRGNVQFTSYFSPIIRVSGQQSGDYPYPIYARPKSWEGKMPTRKEIYKENALAGKGLELAYAKSLIDIQKMQLQGSGFVQFPNGMIYLFSYGGTNKHPRRSVQRYFKENFVQGKRGVTFGRIEKYIEKHPDKKDDILFHNPSYVFFVKKTFGNRVMGAGNVPLTPGLSIASDKYKLPMGTCFLAEVPKPGKRFTLHEPKFLFAQDVGGGVSGAGHVDYYMGIGEDARKRAEVMNHYGRMWLLLPKHKR